MNLVQQKKYLTYSIFPFETDRREAATECQERYKYNFLEVSVTTDSFRKKLLNAVGSKMYPYNPMRGRSKLMY